MYTTKFLHDLSSEYDFFDMMLTNNRKAEQAKGVKTEPKFDSNELRMQRVPIVLWWWDLVSILWKKFNKLKKESIRIFRLIVVFFGLFLERMNAVKIYLKSNLEQKKQQIYMKTPESFSQG